MKIFELHIFGLTIAPTYYALMYILGFGAAWFFLKKNVDWKKSEHLDELIFMAGIGVILGGRIGYILLYNLPFYMANPGKIFAIWEGGMSFHGGLVGVILALIFFSKKFSYPFWKTMDRVAVIAPV